MFGLVFFIAFLFQADQDKFNELRQISNSSSNPYLLPSLLIFGFIFIGILIGVKKVRVKVVDFLKGIIQGATAILRLKNKIGFLIHTFFIWACYISMLWITALALPDIENITINAVFACFIAGTIAIGATPGGIGLYPIMVASALIELYGYDGQVAKSFGMLMWSSQTIFMILLGIISLIAIKKEN
jgi:hypothetical protein